MTALCPHCGYNLRQDETITTGDLHLDPRGVARWRGNDIVLSRSQTIVLHTIVKAAGRPVPRATVAERLGYEGDNPSNLVAVHVCRLRQIMPDIPISNVARSGFRWVE